MSDLVEQVKDYSKELEQALKECNKKFKNVYVFGSNNKILVDTLPCKSLKLRRMMGCDIPLGVIIEAFGQEACGKSSLACYFASQVQRAGKYVVYIDSEHAFNPEYAHILGVDLDKLIFFQPDSGEEGLDLADYAIDKLPNVGLIILDSISTLTPQAELDGNMGDAHMGLQARLISQAMRKLTAKLKAKNISLFCINQLRQKIGISFGDPSVTTGGNALRFYSSLRFRVSRSNKDDIYDNNDIIGMCIKIKAIKNKIGRPFRECTLTYMYDRGILDEEEIIEFGMEMDLIKKWRNFYTINKTGQKFEGIDAILQYYNENEEEKKELVAKIEKYLETGVISEPPAEEEEGEIVDES